MAKFFSSTSLSILKLGLLLAPTLLLISQSHAYQSSSPTISENKEFFQKKLNSQRLFEYGHTGGMIRIRHDDYYVDVPYDQWKVRYDWVCMQSKKNTSHYIGCTHAAKKLFTMACNDMDYSYEADPVRALKVHLMFCEAASKYTPEGQMVKHAVSKEVEFINHASKKLVCQRRMYNRYIGFFTLQPGQSRTYSDLEPDKTIRCRYETRKGQATKFTYSPVAQHGRYRFFLTQKHCNDCRSKWKYETIIVPANSNMVCAPTPYGCRN